LITSTIKELLVYYKTGFSGLAVTSCSDDHRERVADCGDDQPPPRAAIKTALTSSLSRVFAIHPYFLRAFAFTAGTL